MLSFKIYKRFFVLLFILSLPLLLFSCQGKESVANMHRQEFKEISTPSLERIKTDPVMGFLGNSFDEIKRELGEPDEEGYSGLYGPHYYLLYLNEEGFLRFCSPEFGDNVAVSIILGPGQKVQGAKVGMLFADIKDVLGPPDFGPELGMDNLYYMEYHFGEMKNQIPEVYVSFTADSISTPTVEAFIKWERFYDQVEMQVGQP